MQTLSGIRACQRADELLPFCKLMAARGVRRYLEIGARHGDTLYEVARHVESTELLVAVDLPGAVWGGPDSEENLHRACSEVAKLGKKVAAILGSSADPTTSQRVFTLSPEWDATLIDGDHRYDAAMADFDRYGIASRMIAFHDIVGEGQRHGPGINIEVPRVWRALKKRYHRDATFTEFVGRGSKMGIGVMEWR